MRLSSARMAALLLFVAGASFFRAQGQLVLAEEGVERHENVFEGLVFESVEVFSNSTGNLVGTFTACDFVPHGRVLDADNSYLRYQLQSHVGPVWVDQSVVVTSGQNRQVVLGSKLRAAASASGTVRGIGGVSEREIFVCKRMEGGVTDVDE